MGTVQRLDKSLSTWGVFGTGFNVFPIGTSPSATLKKLLSRYEEQKDKIFCNKQELLAYCMDDVNVLRNACCAFRNFFLKLVKMDPFREAITISSICNKVFRTMFLKPDTVGIIPRECEIASMLKLFNGWRILVGQETVLLMPVMEGRFICLGYQM